MLVVHLESDRIVEVLNDIRDVFERPNSRQTGPLSDVGRWRLHQFLDFWVEFAAHFYSGAFRDRCKAQRDNKSLL